MNLNSSDGTIDVLGTNGHRSWHRILKSHMYMTVRSEVA